jgi:hypothetical protein
MSLFPLFVSLISVFHLTQATPSPMSPPPVNLPGPPPPATNTMCTATATSGRTQFTYTIILAPDKLKPATISVFRRSGSASSGSPVLRNGNLTNYEQDAPDADYSRPPFDREFRGAPNNGKWIYWYQGSVHGLYVSALPKTGTVQRVQVVHYLSRDGSIKSSVATCQ